jgi:superfamily II DNA or RNA helicase
MKYKEFLRNKIPEVKPCGLAEVPSLRDFLFEYQRDCVKWALKRGRGAFFWAPGLGKTPSQLEWARVVAEVTGQKVLILAPLAVAKQTANDESKKFKEDAKYCKNSTEAAKTDAQIIVTNYERVDDFDCSVYGGVVPDESGILKGQDSKTFNKLCELFSQTRFKLCCTATPSPNDHMELGQHAEFLGICSREEMLTNYFIHDGKDTAKWRLKKHARKDFWKWVASWAISISKPSDLGYSDEGFNLPPLNYHLHLVHADIKPSEGMLIPDNKISASNLHSVMRQTTDIRVEKVKDILTDEQVVIWCNTNYESDEISKEIDGVVDVRGSDTQEHKEESIYGFAQGKIKRIVSKASIAGYGVNWQKCNTQVFCGLSYSFEDFYQAVRRCWRFMQKKPVNVHIVVSDVEGTILETVKRKQAAHEEMQREMILAMKDEEVRQLKGEETKKAEFKQAIRASDKWILHLNDCVDAVKEIKSDSIHYSIFSPPFSSLYTYSDSKRDMGNCSDDKTFIEHFKFLVPELYRVTMPGRLLSFHCMNLPSSKSRDGVIGLKDFRGDLIRLFQDCGWIYHSEVCIWKDPLIAATRTKALGLLHKQICKDSSMCRQGIADYLVTMRKPGENPERVSHKRGFETYIGENAAPTEGKNENPMVNKYSHVVWQRYASPVWMDIDQTDTLNGRNARDANDERHICPLQLQVIERGIELWTNPGDTVLSPFAGIGSEGYCAVKMKRKFIGIELKESYYLRAIENLKAAENIVNEKNLFCIANNK